MTEQEWLSCSDPNELLTHTQQTTSDCIQRLLACACCRHLWPLFADAKSQEAVSVAEAYADGLAARTHLDHVRQKVTADADTFWVSIYLLYPEMEAFNSLENLLVHLAEESCQVNPSAKNSYEFERVKQCQIIRDIVGNPFRPVNFNPDWRLPGVIAMAQAMYDQHWFADLPILADAIEESGCENPDVLGHCRKEQNHVRGCWVLDMILEKR